VELDKHTILPDSRLSFDHTPLSIDIPIFEEIIQSLRFSITPKSDQEMGFIKDIISNFKSLDTADIDNSKKLEQLVNQLGLIIKQSWSKNAKKSRISKHSKQCVKIVDSGLHLFLFSFLYFTFLCFLFFIFYF